MEDLRLNPQLRLCAKFDETSIAKFPVAAPKEMGMRVLAQSARRFPPRQAPGRSGGQFSFPRLRPASPSDILRHNKASMFSTHVLMSGITWRFLRQIDKKKSYISASFIRSKYSF